jgi:hypothetical protein
MWILKNSKEHINEVVEEFVGRYNNIFVMEVRQVFSNI